ncbi:hypothetical protein ACSQ67_002110 [Phaseolus vulgaris]
MLTSESPSSLIFSQHRPSFSGPKMQLVSYLLHRRSRVAWEDTRLQHLATWAVVVSGGRVKEEGFVGGAQEDSGSRRLSIDEAYGHLIF